MKLSLSKIAAIAFATILSSTQTSAAVFVKYDGVDGEAKDNKPAKVKRLDKSSPKTAGLLLPAVQKVKGASAKPQKRKVVRKKIK